jgi:hypothetical protein
LPARAQDEKRDAAKLLAPYVNETTFAAVEIDVQKLDLDVLFRHLQRPKLPEGAREELAKEQEQARQFRAAFLRAGGRRVYFVFNNPESLPGGPQPLILIPADKAEAREALQQFLGQLRFLKTEVKGDLVLAGTEHVIPVGSRRAQEVPQLAQGFTAVSEYDQRVVVRLPEALRRSLEELVPKLPPEFGGGSIKTITRDLRWIAAGADFGDKLQVRVLGQTENGQAAKDLAVLSRRALELALKDIPDLASLVDVLSPKAAGGLVELKLEANTIDTAVLPLIAKMRARASQAQSTNNLKQIALAFHNYHDVTKAFPPQWTQDKKKRPLLSWRVHILPYIEQNALYKQFKLDEPWDSPHNKKYLTMIPVTYRSPLARPDLEPGKTTYIMPAGPKLLFNGAKLPKIQQITDGTSNTVLVLDADDSRAVYWTKPDDWEVDPKEPTKGAGKPGIGILAALCDGSVHVLPTTIKPEIFWALLTPRGGEVIDWEKVHGK